MTTLPTPSPIALFSSEKLIAHIKQEIYTAGGYIDFARFMDLALYTPELGYYTGGAHKLGQGGDFVTAPEISPLFAECMARQFQQILEHLPAADILELGAGSGIFAKELLLALEKANVLPEHYYILEVSAELRDRQAQRFKLECPHLLSGVTWLDTLPAAPFNGIIFANEVLDAMPFHRFLLQHGDIKECCVAWENDQLVWQLEAPSLELQKRVENILAECELPDFYCSEVSFIQSAWINSVADILQQGVILLIDYGYARREYYHPERQNGTLTCFYQHHHHDNPLTLIGLQDISAHVDFTALAESADQAGLKVAGFTSQAAFLLACGLLEIAEQKSGDEKDKHMNNIAIKTLSLPSQMGEVMKVMALTQNWDLPLLGFQLQDRRRDL